MRRWLFTALAATFCLVGAATCTIASRDAIAASPTGTPNDTEVVSFIDAQVRLGWADANLAPSAVAADGEWLRRVFLDLVGRIPRVDEVEAYLADSSKDKRRALVDRLLASEEYAEEFSRHCATVWTNLLIGRTAGNEPRSLVSRDGMQQYLRRSFARNKPYDQMVSELVTATGANRPGADDYNGAVNFLLSAVEDNGIQATAKTARLFLGLQVQCTQCHNHPVNNWKQSQFWGLNAFFRQTVPLRTTLGRDIVEVRLADQDFAGEGGNPEQAEIYYELRNGKLEAVFPTFVDGREIPASGLLADVNRRAELAKLVISSEFFSPAIVNRVWGHFFGYGFTKPVDDLGPHNPPTHPELLSKVAADFVASGYDLRRLMRWVVLSEAYGLSSQSNEKNRRDDPALGEKPRFSHFYLRQISAEQLYESLLTAMQAEATVAGSADELQRQKQEWLRQFAVAFGNDEGGEATRFDGSIPQSLMMINGELVGRATSIEPESFLATLCAREKKDAVRLRTLYLAALSRPPSRAEIAAAGEVLAEAGSNPLEGWQDIWWALLNANEFILNH